MFERDEWTGLHMIISERITIVIIMDPTIRSRIFSKLDVFDQKDLRGWGIFNHDFREDDEDERDDDLFVFWNDGMKMLLPKKNDTVGTDDDDELLLHVVWLA